MGFLDLFRRPGSRASGHPDPPDFARLRSAIVDALHAAGEDVVEMSPRRIACRRGEDLALVELDTAWDRYCAVAPKERAAVVERFARVPPSARPAFEDARDRIVFRVRPRGYVSAFELDLECGFPAGGSAPLVLDGLGDHLDILISLDVGEHYLHVSQPILDAWSTTLDVLDAIAQANLPKLASEELTPGVFAFKHENAPAQLLRGDELASSLPFDGPPAAICPKRDLLLACDATDPKAVETMIECAGEAHPRLVQDTAGTDFAGGQELLLVRRDGIWKSVRPEELCSPSAHAYVRAGWRVARFHAVQEQSGRLEKVADLEGGGPVVCPILLAPGTRRDGTTAEEVTVYAVPGTDIVAELVHATLVVVLPEPTPDIEEDVPYLIHQADEVLMLDEDGDPFALVSWESFATAMGDALEVLEELWPPAYQFVGFPSIATLDRMEDSMIEEGWTYVGYTPKEEG